jgi:hypothetical protein
VYSCVLSTLWAISLPVNAQTAPVVDPALEAPRADPDALPDSPAGRDRTEKEDKGDKKGADEEAGTAAVFRLHTRVMAGFEYERERPSGAQTRLASSDYGLLVKQVRLGLSGELADRLRTNVSFDLSDALDPETGTTYSSPPYIRTATLEYRWSRALRLTVGRFKRPFSQLELQSAADLPILDRGLFNNLAIEDNQWGDRAVGAMLSGRLKDPKLRYYLSVTNPGWSSSLDIQGIDVLGRVQLALSKDLSLAINGGYKRIEFSNDLTVNGSAIGADADIEIGDAHLMLEAEYLDLLFATDRPHGLGASLLFDYLLELGAGWALQPTFFFEYADANSKVSQSESVRLTLGVNALTAGSFRVMPQVSLVRSIGDTSQDNPWYEGETLSLILSLVL